MGDGGSGGDVGAECMSHSKETIIVAGLGRCGSSLVMQMLNAAGIPTTGEYPSFEDDRVNLLSTESLWSGEFKGRAVKILDPHRRDLHLNGCRVIWLRRNERQQARSIVKFFEAATGRECIQNRSALRKLERSLVDDAQACKRVLRANKGPWMELSFEDLILKPQAAAQRLAEFTGGDAETMAAVVRKRGVECYPGLLEIDLLEAVQASQATI